MRAKADPCILFLALLLICSAKPIEVLPGGVGAYYPGPTALLEKMITTLESTSPTNTIPKTIRGMIVPHAAYRFAGQTMGMAYAELSSENYAAYDGVVILAEYEGKTALVPDFDIFRIPGARVPMDRNKARLFAASPAVDVNYKRFNTFYQMEVHLPFIHKHFPGLPVLPVMLPEGDPETALKVSRLVREHCGSSLIISSVNLSYSKPGAVAEKFDAALIKSIISRDISSIEKCYSDQGEVRGSAALTAFFNSFSEDARRAGHMELIKYTDDAVLLFEGSLITTYGSFIFYDKVKK